MSGIGGINEGALDAYRSALKQGQREFHACIARGANPYPALLDDELPDALSARQESLGLLEAPIERIVGVRSASRQTAFSAGFLPLLEDSSEFAVKWMALYNAHVEEGIRDPVILYETMNRYFVLEGNKRVSVLRYSGATHVPAVVTRFVPPRDGTEESEVYYEYLAFYRVSHFVDIYFSEPGRFPRLLKALGCDAESVWTEEDRRALAAAYQRFREAYADKAARGGAPVADAFLTFLEINGYQAMREMTQEEIGVSLQNALTEIAAAESDDGIALMLSPTPASEAPFLNKLWPAHPSVLRAAFLYERTALTSPWTAAHEAGRRRMEKRFGGRVLTTAYDGVIAGETDEETLERAIEDGAEVVFTTTPKLIGASVKAAVRHPEAKVLNCSMNMQHPSVRTYYGRVYEAKFLVGALAGALCGEEYIGYIADYPIYGVAANINAFAMGAQMANPRAKIRLEWSCVRDRDPYAVFASEGITLISGRDLRNIDKEGQTYGLYRLHADGPDWLALPYWRWSRLYRGILGSILSGTWKTDAAEAGSQAINYWWGIDSGVLDVLASGSLPRGTRRLLEVLHTAVQTGALDPLQPFPEPYAASEERATKKSPSPAEILRMDTLNANVIGRIPALDELIEEAKPMVRLQGLHTPGVRP